ncbi:hypothetical protein GCM10027280_18470 [Micromonospora polyrhachis]|uniref:DNA-binding protein YbaB n=1 Tax=Micromonospora polyrhachis TaxID=1282883 RepID=A0A7W7WMT5_9ACTN|nr:YbaB/EbfC family nucleoid-associated protein [Micromonospora polyrhachis]MBB4956942.1 DNA-binding protein YbaB [Micromonospora polyrhachis]
MASGFEAAINEMLAELERQRESMTRMQQGLAAVTGSATAPKRQLSVVVDAHGEITELKFLNQSYRSMSATELANLIVTTIQEARRDARVRLAEQVGGVGVDGADLHDLVDGQVDWGRAFSDALTVPQPFLDMLQRPPTDLLDGVDLDRVDLDRVDLDRTERPDSHEDASARRPEPGADR